MLRKRALFIATAFAVLQFGPLAGTAERPVPAKEKEFAFKVVERNAKAIALLGDNIFYFAELGMQEFETAKLMTEVLDKAGFKVERGTSGMAHGRIPNLLPRYGGRGSTLAKDIPSSKITRCVTGFESPSATVISSAARNLSGPPRTDARSHRVISYGGDQPNVIPGLAKIWWFFRETTIDRAQENFEKAKRVAQGAATMTNTDWSVQVLSAIWPTRGNRTMAEVTQKNVEVVGMPKWSEAEEQLARELQQKQKVKVIGLHHETVPLRQSTQGASSNDSGEITWIVPTGRVTFPSNIPGVPAHHWAAGVAPATSLAHKGAVAGAKVLAASVIDFMLEPKLVDEAKATFKKEIGTTQYKSFLPADQKPPIHLNKELMERYRPELSKFYMKEKPRFE